LVTTLLFESEEKIENAEESLDKKQWSDSIYYSYTALVNTAKALLTAEEIKTNTQTGIIKSFDEHFITTNAIELSGTFSELVFQLKDNEPTSDFSEKYLEDAKSFYKKVDEFRATQIVQSN